MENFFDFCARVARARALYCRLRYSWRLAWAKAAR
jgi:hypothetical protein